MVGRVWDLGRCNQSLSEPRGAALARGCLCHGWSRNNRDGGVEGNLDLPPQQIPDLSDRFLSVLLEDSTTANAGKTSFPWCGRDYQLRYQPH